jgi:hypothetical protein
MDEAHLHPWEPGDDKRFGKSGVQPLVRDAIAVEYDGIAVVETEGLRPCGAGQKKNA